MEKKQTKEKKNTKMSSGFVEKKREETKQKKKRRWLVGGWGKLKVEVGKRDPGPVLPGVVQAVCQQEDDGRSRVHGGDEAALHHSGVLTVFSDPRTGLPTLRPRSHLLMSNPPTQRSLQANHRLRGQKYS